MTRINVVDPSTLSTKHLIAEYRELPRIFGLVHKAIERGEKPDDRRNPDKYVLGKGHVRFFYPRLLWLVKRQEQLVKECLDRGFNIKFDDPRKLIENIPESWLNDWIPDQESVRLNVDRINERGGLR